jgi:hypothetical protein
MLWSVIKPALTELVRSIASEDVEVPLRDGVVTWFGEAVPFIAPETQAGIYLRILTHNKRGRPGRKYSPVTVGGLPKIVETRTKQEKFTWQIQAKSLEEDPFSGGQTWIDRLTDNIWDRSVLSYLKKLGISIIEIKPTVELQEKTPVDGTIGYDSRNVSFYSVDIIMHVVNIVSGRPIDFIERVSTSGQITGTTNDPVIVPPFYSVGIP